MLLQTNAAQLLRFSNMLCFEPIGKSFSHDVTVSTSEAAALDARFRPQICIRTVKHLFSDTMALHFSGGDVSGSGSERQAQLRAAAATSCFHMLSHWCELAWYTAGDRRLLLLLMLLNLLSPHRFLSRQNLLASVITLHARYLQFLKQYTATSPPLSAEYRAAAPDFNEELLDALDVETRAQCAIRITRTSIRAHMPSAASSSSSSSEPFSLFAFAIAALNDERMFEQSAENYRALISCTRHFTPLIAEMLEISDPK